jgi:lipopolysaccharide export system ATP-binding protein
MKDLENITAQEKDEIQTASEPLASARSLVKIYSGRRVVDRVNIDVYPGEIVGLLGPNGAGKTTTFYMVTGLIQPDDGKVFFQQTDVTREPMHRRARRGMGYLAQEPTIFRRLSVWENMMAIAETISLTRKEQQILCQDLLDELGIIHLRDAKSYALSGGERRRLEIARALLTRPSFLLLDEPFSGIDPKAVFDVQDIILSLQNKGLAILITDHNVRETLRVCDRAYLIFEGRVQSHGTAEFLSTDPVTRELYLGEHFRI